MLQFYGETDSLLTGEEEEEEEEKDEERTSVEDWQ